MGDGVTGNTLDAHRLLHLEQEKSERLLLNILPGPVAERLKRDDAAVADYFVANAPQQKVKKTAMRMSISLDPTPDILAEVGQKKGDRLLVGFAAETENLVEEARRKMKSKNCDMVVGNLVGDALGFDSDENEVVLVLTTGETVKLPRASKRAIADSIFDQVMRLRLALHAAQ